jgi:hypothetical protein
VWNKPEQEPAEEEHRAEVRVEHLGHPYLLVGTPPRRGPGELASERPKDASEGSQRAV